MSCQHQILGLRRYHFISYASVISETGQDSLCSQIHSRCLAVFRPVCWLAKDVPAHTSLNLAVKASSGRQPACCRCLLGHPGHSWTTQIESDSRHCAVWDVAGDRWRWGRYDSVPVKQISECVSVVTKRMCGWKFMPPVLWHSLVKLCTKNYENLPIFLKVTAKNIVARFLCGHTQFLCWLYHWLYVSCVCVYFWTSVHRCCVWMH